MTFLIGLALAFTVLLLATWLPLVALFSTLSIVCTLISVMGGMVMLGWELGSIESILISITAGFSVDYVVHLAHAMVQKEGLAVDERIRESFREMVGFVHFTATLRQNQHQRSLPLPQR